jgi:quinolinate synthase
MNAARTLIPFEDRYTLPPVEAIPDSPEEIRAKQERIQRWKEERNAVLLAHNYQRAEVQEAADFVGDSLGL